MKAKKFCIIALVLVIVLLIAPISESRAEGKPEVKISGDYEYYILDDGTACIKRYYGIDEEVIVPEKLDGIRVTGIGDYAFWGETNLKEITINENIENIGKNPFDTCVNLTDINISVNHPTLEFIDNALIYKPEKRLVSYLRSSKESKYEIPEGIKIIGENAFWGCDNLKEINIPDSVENIRNYAISGCENLKEITIPDGVKFIGDGAFYDCTSLTKITIPDSVENIGINLFEECNKLLNIEISANNSTLEFVDNALIYKPEKKLVIYLSTSKESKYEIPEEIEIIGDIAFYGCKNLKEIKIPDGVKLLGDKAFEGCTNLDEIKIPDNVQSIGFNAFFRCINLKKINIPASVKYIGEEAFKYCNILIATVAKDSYAEKYCVENNIKYMYED
ncbi:MAG: leucine-rich repeat domain-containing protein [Eubacteriales bacterium]|nr:leucine-rich repeat domain-containing protein [Eubacteriales bacterium]